MNIAVFGLGSAGARHARILESRGHAVRGFDPRTDPPPGVRRTGSPEEALDGADAAIVASPSAFHEEHAIAAIEYGVPVLVEKPLAVDGPAARRVVAASLEAGVLCAAAMNLRFHPGPEGAREMVSSGRLGQVLFARASFGYDLRKWRPGVDYRVTYSARRDLGGGILLDAIHELDYLLWTLGPVAQVTAMLGTVSDLEIDVEDAVVGCLRFASGALGTVDLNFFEPTYRRGCTIVGSEGVVEWDWAASTITVRGTTQFTRTIESDVTPTYAAELDDFLAAVESGGEPRTGAVEGYAAVALADAFRRSASEAVVVEPEPWTT